MTTTALPPARRAARVRPVVSAKRRALETGTFVVAGLLAWVVLYLTVLSGFSHGHAQAELYGSFRSDLAAGTAPLMEPIPHGRPVAMLDAPAIGLRHEIVVQGTTPSDLQKGPGHALGTVLPGQAGTSVLMGRSVSFGGPFSGVANARLETKILVTTGQGTFTYVVTARRSEGDTFKAPSAGAGRLTLITLGGGNRWTPNKTVFIDLDLVGKPASAGLMVQPDPNGAPMAHDLSVGTVALFILSLQLVLLVIVGFIWGRTRWSGVGAWVAGVPALLMALWLAGSFASRMALPNLF
jgi:sortase A